MDDFKTLTINQLNRIENKIDVMSTEINHTIQKTFIHDEKFESHEKYFASIDNKIKEIEEKKIPEAFSNIWNKKIIALGVGIIIFLNLFVTPIVNNFIQKLFFATTQKVEASEMIKK